MSEAHFYSSTPGSRGACSQQGCQASPREVEHYSRWKKKHPIIMEPLMNSEDLKIHGRGGGGGGKGTG